MTNLASTIPPAPESTPKHEGVIPLTVLDMLELNYQLRAQALSQMQSATQGLAAEVNARVFDWLGDQTATSARPAAAANAELSSNKAGTLLPPAPLALSDGE